MAEQYEYLRLSGLVVPDTSITRAAVESEFRLVFGQDLNVSGQTPQGVLINLFTAERNAVISNNAALANQINPNIAGGVFLDAIASLSDFKREASKSSVVSCDLAGTPLLPIPAGVTAKTSQGNVFALVNSVALDGTGAGVGSFASVEKGPIPALAGTLNSIASGVPGWETVTNPLAATLGTVTESDESFRILRRVTLAKQGIATPEAIISNVNAIPNIRSSLIRENKNITPQNIDNVTLAGKSIYVSVDGDGASDLEIAQVLLDKPLEVTWTGSTTVPLVEPISGQSYDVKFTRANKILILVRIKANSDGSIPNPVDAIKQSIVDYSNGDLEGEQGLIVGRNISPSELARAISKPLYPGIFIESVEISYSAPIVFTKDELPIEIFEVGTIIETGIEVILT